MKLEAFQCPICLSTHFRVENDTYICLSCGNSYTKKQADSQMFIDLRIANSLRQFADFSKAKAMYESIIAKYPDEDLSLAYWGLLLCDQQVIVETDSSGQLFPSFYRVKSQGMETSPVYKRFYDYVKAVSPEKMSTFAERINLINEARKKAIVISQTTKPYDVFICFKKTQLDSDFVTSEYDLANEIYNNIAMNYRTFYSEKSLKGIKIREYEPNIFYGLYTAKVMLLICSKKEFLESHWMKNEWQRFLQINKNRELGSRCIIPIFTDNFTPDDLPTELAHLQGLKCGISLISDIEKELQNIINPIDKDAEQQKQIDALMENQRKLQEEWAKQQKMSIEGYLDESKPISATKQDLAIQSILKLAKVNIEDLANFDEAYELVHRAQQIDAENYLTWYYKLLIDFRAQSKLALVMYPNYKDSINYRLMVKYAKSPQAKEFVNSIDEERENYLMNLAEKVNIKLRDLDSNLRPTNEDIASIKLIYESLEKEAKAYVKDIKIIVPNALKRIRENRVQDFNLLLNVVKNKEYPNYDDIIKVQESYKTLSEDEQNLTNNYKKVIVDASNKMKMGKVKLLQQALDELDKQEEPKREDIIKIEKKYNQLEDEYKPHIKNYSLIMANAYDKKYIKDAKQLKAYLNKLPTEKVPNPEIYAKLENRYKMLPKKYRQLVTNIQNLDDYYDRLNGKKETRQTIKPEIKEEKKKKLWLFGRRE